MKQVNENLRKSCEEAMVVCQKLNDEKLKDIQANLEWCLGSYLYDKNPEGLIDYGNRTLKLFKSIKAKQPRKINKKVIDSLEKALVS